VLQSMRSAAKYIFWFIAITFIGGFLLAETSGLLGRSSVTTSTVVAKINGQEVLYTTWAQASQQRAVEQERQMGHSLSLDDRRRLDEETFDQLVQSILLQQEYKKRGIRVTDEEIVQAAQFSPPPALLQAQELQTDGRFDIEKYQRFLKSPAARQQGLLVQLEGYYRTEIPRAKLFDQVAAEVYVTDARLWQMFKDQHDSAQVSFVAFDPNAATSPVTVSDAETKSYYDTHKKEFERPGRAAISLVTIPRVITSADSQAVRNKVLALRDEILKGAKFEDVAKRESNDTLSGAQGGSLGKGGKGRFLADFEKAAYALKPGELSEPVQTQFGYHLIKVDSRKGDTIDVRHILLRIQQSDSTAAKTDSRADTLVKIAGSADQPSRLDSAAKKLGLQIQHGVAFEGEPLVHGGRPVPSVSAWAFGGAKPGETSDLFDAEDGYYLARLDSLTSGGVPSLDAAKDEIKRRLTMQKKLDRLLPDAQQLATQAAASNLEQTAQAKNLKVEHPPAFTRISPVPGLGRLNEAVGAAFALPVGAVGAPVRTNDGVFVIRVDRRVESSKAEFEKQKAAQRQTVLSSLRQQRVRAFLENLRRTATVDDRRKDVQGRGPRAS
jgi:peptidyl-prolyl cis-trans isomerase D